MALQLGNYNSRSDVHFCQEVVCDYSRHKIANKDRLGRSFVSIYFHLDSSLKRVQVAFGK